MPSLPVAAAASSSSLLPTGDLVRSYLRDIGRVRTAMGDWRVSTAGADSRAAGRVERAATTTRELLTVCKA